MVDNIKKQTGSKKTKPLNYIENLTLLLKITGNKKFADAICYELKSQGGISKYPDYVEDKDRYDMTDNSKRCRNDNLSKSEANSIKPGKDSYDSAGHFTLELFEYGSSCYEVASDVESINSSDVESIRSSSWSSYFEEVVSDSSISIVEKRTVIKTADCLSPSNTDITENSSYSLDEEARGSKKTNSFHR